MKKSSIIASSLLTILTLSTFATPVLADTANTDATITFKKNTGGAGALYDPEDFSKKVTLDDSSDGVKGTASSLMIEFAPHFKFGTDKELVATNQDYFTDGIKVKREGETKAVKRGHFVEVSDYREKDLASGWNLTASLGEMKNGTDKLTGVTLTLSNAYTNTFKNATKVATPGAIVLNAGSGGSTSIFSGTAANGWGTHSIEFGRPALDGDGNPTEATDAPTKSTIGNSVKLSIPAQSKRAVEYKGTILWTLS